MAGSSLCGGRAYAILERFLRQYVYEATGLDMNQYDVMARLAERGELDKKQYPELKIKITFNGTRISNREFGEILDITENNFLPKYLIYGFMEGMVRELYEMYIQIKNVTGLKAETMVVSGNGIRKNKVLQKIAKESFRM